MAGYMLRRVASSLVTLFVFLSLLFFLAHILIPGDFVTQFTLGMSSEAREALRDQLGLNDPLWRQYLTFVGGVFSGDLWSSESGPSLLSVILTWLPVTLVIFVVAMGIAFPVGFALGRNMAWRRDRAGRNALSIGAVAFHTAFPPLLVFLVLWSFLKLFGRAEYLEMRALGVGGVPDWNAVSSTAWFIALSLVIAAGAAGLVAIATRRWRTRWRRSVPWLTAVVVPPLIWLFGGQWSTAIDVMYWLSVPIVVVFLLSVGEVMLITDSSMAGVAREDYILAARAKGLSERLVRDRHASRVALLPALSRLLVSVPFFLSGLMIIELTMRIPGLSSVLFTSLENRDVPTVIAGLLFIGLIVLGTRLLLDFLMLYLDPRIRTGQVRA